MNSRHRFAIAFIACAALWVIAITTACSIHKWPEHAVVVLLLHFPVAGFAGGYFVARPTAPELIEPVNE